MVLLNKDSLPTAVFTPPVVAEPAPVYNWEQFTIGQNKKIQEMVAAAAKAQELVAANMQIAKTGAAAAKLFLTAVLNPKGITYFQLNGLPYIQERHPTDITSFFISP